MSSTQINSERFYTIISYNTAKLTAVTLDPSFFHARAVIVYKLRMSFTLGSSHICLRGLQFRTRNLWQQSLGIISSLLNTINYGGQQMVSNSVFFPWVVTAISERYHVKNSNSHVKFPFILDEIVRKILQADKTDNYFITFWTLPPIHTYQSFPQQ